MCCGRKKQRPAEPSKPPVANNSNILREPNLQQTNPKSKVTFLANDYNYSPMQNEKSFVSTKKANIFVQDRSDRLEDYGQESKVAAQSKLIAPLSLMNYELDGTQGISGNPTVDTFHYEAALSHWFLHTNKTDFAQTDSHKYAVMYEPATQNYEKNLLYQDNPEF